MKFVHTIHRTVLLILIISPMITCAEEMGLVSNDSLVSMIDSLDTLSTTGSRELKKSNKMKLKKSKKVKDGKDSKSKKDKKSKKSKKGKKGKKGKKEEDSEDIFEYDDDITDDGEFEGLSYYEYNATDDDEFGTLSSRCRPNRGDVRVWIQISKLSSVFIIDYLLCTISIIHYNLFAL